MTHTKETLTALLQTGAVHIKFRKASGEIRELRATLHPSKLPPLPEVDPSKPKKAVNPDQVNVWSLDDGGWRSFMVDSLVEEPTLIQGFE